MSVAALPEFALRQFLPTPSAGPAAAGAAGSSWGDFASSSLLPALLAGSCAQPQVWVTLFAVRGLLGRGVLLLLRFYLVRDRHETPHDPDGDGGLDVEVGHDLGSLFLRRHPDAVEQAT